MQSPPFKFKFSLLPGDLIYALAGVKHACERYRCKAIIYLGLNIQWPMSDHVKIGRLIGCTLTGESMAMIKPLLEAQPYIESVQSWEQARPEEYAEWGNFFKVPRTQPEILEWYKSNMRDVVDLDKHHLLPVNIPMGNIARWNFYTYPDLACDLSEHWLDTVMNPMMPPNTIIINRTARYQNKAISYSFLKPLEPRLLFAGTDEEYDAFRFDHNVNLPRLVVNNFLELAVAINSCAFFIGNQSLCFALAEALKVPRILEVYTDMPNVIPCGQKAYDFYFNSCFETYVNELAK